MFTIGYERATKYGLKQAKYIACCVSCKFNDIKTGECLNKEVTSFDFIDGKNVDRSYCCFWLPVGVENEKRF